VMPKLRGVLPQCDGDERFWCKPLAKRVTAGGLPTASSYEHIPEHA